MAQNRVASTPRDRIPCHRWSCERPIHELLLVKPVAGVVRGSTNGLT